MITRILRRLRAAATALAGGEPERAPAEPAANARQALAAALPLPLLELLARGLEPELPEVERYRIAEGLSTAVYPQYKFSEYGRIFLDDREFLAAYERFMDAGNWHSLDRKYTLVQLLKLALDLPGDVAECGVYKGGSAWLMCQAIRPVGKVNHLFDSFEGLSQPGPDDGTYWSPGGLRIDESVVRRNLAEFDNVEFHKGWFPAPFEAVRERRFAFVHVDVDLFQPTLDALEFFYPRLVEGGVMLFDDYGFVTCPGARLAVDQFFESRPERVALLPTGQAFVVKKAERPSAAS
ncbi:MAG: TylF/MycF family methyltransferase [Vicinamibacteria bacterium]|nr:TylF/MycF family methyltransferase [Vicinamibacteria bacterium]